MRSRLFRVPSDEPTPLTNETGVLPEGRLPLFRTTSEQEQEPVGGVRPEEFPDLPPVDGLGA